MRSLGCGVLRNLRRSRAQRATDVPQHRRTATHEYIFSSYKLLKTTDAFELTVFHSCLAFAMGNSSSVVSSLPDSFSGPMNSLYDAAGKNAYNLVGLAVLAVAVSWFTKRPKGPFPPGPKVRLNLDLGMSSLFNTNHPHRLGDPILRKCLPASTFVYMGMLTLPLESIKALMHCSPVQIHGVGRTIWSHRRTEYGWSAYGRLKHRQSLRRSYG